jgi:hypothetical protein
VDGFQASIGTRTTDHSCFQAVRDLLAYLQRELPMPAKDGWPLICYARKQVAYFLLKVWPTD